MALIGEIAVNIVAKTGQFTKGMNAVRKQLNTTASALGKFGAAVTGGFAVAVKSFVSLGDQINDMATRTGFAVETLSALDFAAGQSGTSLAALETGIKGMAKAMLTAQQGSTTMIDNFQQLGLTVQQLQAMSPDQQFLTLADRLSKIEDPTQKAALAMKVFGRSGADLIPLLQGGEKGVIALTEKAKELGVVWSKTDVAAAAALDDAINALWTQLKTVFKEIAVAVSGPLLQFAEGLQHVTARTIAWLKESQGVTAWLAKVGVAAAALSIPIKGLAVAIGFLTNAVKGLAAAFIFLTKHPLAILLTLVAAGTVKILDSVGAFDKLKESILGIGGAAETAGSQVAALTDKLGESSTAALEQRIQNTKKLIDQLEGLQALAKGGGGTLRDPASVGIARDLAEQRRALRFLEAQLADKQRPAREAAEAAEAQRKAKAGGGLLGGLVGDIRKAIVSAADSVTGGRLPHQGFLAQIGGIINSIGDAINRLPQQQADAIQEVTRSSNAIIQRGTQEAAEFAAAHRQRQAGTPEKKIEKNTADTVKAVNAVKAAINKLATGFGREEVFTIPAS